MQEAEVGHNTFLPVIIGDWLDDFERELPRVALGFYLVCTLQAFARQQYGTDVHVLPYALYSNETCVTFAGTHIHPIILSLCLPLDIMRRQHTHQRIAFLPILGPAQFGMDAVVDMER